MSASDTKSRLLEAAGRVVLSRGAAGLTLDAVAEEAGLSKGGLLYHYGSKEALLAAMVQHLVDVTEDRISAHRAADDDPGSWTRGYLQACVVEELAENDPAGRLAIALLAAGASAPELIASIRERQGEWRRRLADDGIDPVTAMIVRLAADGLWMSDLFGLPVLSSAERRAVLERLDSLTRAAR